MARHRHVHMCALCGSDTGEWNGRLKKCSACRRVTYCSRRCQRAHWSAHRAACKQEPLHLWWRHLSGSSSPQLPSWAVVAAVGGVAILLMLVLCSGITTQTSWLSSAVLS